MAFVGRTDVKDAGAGQQWERLWCRRERLYEEAMKKSGLEIPHVIVDLIGKYVTDMELTGLL